MAEHEIFHADMDICWIYFNRNQFYTKHTI